MLRVLMLKKSDVFHIIPENSDVRIDHFGFSTKRIIDEAHLVFYTKPNGEIQILKSRI